MKQIVIEIIENALKELDVSVPENLSTLIETPKDYTNGDFAFACFSLAKELKKSPQQIATDLRELMHNPPEEFEEIQTSGPYINFYLNRKLLAQNLIQEIKDKGNDFGSAEALNKKLVIEFPSPNTNKPLHLGHLRNMAIGESISRIAQANGYEVVRANLNNDRGVHICKSMLAYQRWGEGKTPIDAEEKSDHFVGDFYVKFAEELKKDSKLEEESQEMLKKWEAGDSEIIALWKKMNAWALDGFKQTYKKFGITIDKEYFESQIYKEGKDIILGGLEKGIFQKREDGAIVINLEDEKLGEKVLLRSDGTSIYITQDIYLAKVKFDDFNPDESVYVTGNEQEYHFKVLFSVLDKLGLTDKEKLKHLAYGMVNLPNGRMKSREGTVVDADDLISEIQSLVKKELEARDTLEEKELENRSLKISLSALKYFLLKVDVKRDMVFNPEESISFEGDTGPYCQYSYARASSIMRKAGEKPEVIYPEELEDKEAELILKINEFKKVVADAYRTMNPALVANYAYKLSQVFNEFYHSCSVIDSIYKGLRLELTDSFRQVLKNALNLLGIQVIEVM
ncbi:MAG: arginine--tRNA ligase [Nanoarchaeota archaeon]|jgi:arginyl-tRNA synthetase|nr:arginine--tRNA ligase [Nanoarchaeota archaeon]